LASPYGMFVETADDQVEDVVDLRSTDADLGGRTGGEAVQRQEFPGEGQYVVDVIGEQLPQICIVGCGP